MDKKTFLGVGIKFPPQIDKNTGRFKLSMEEENIKESIYILLMTSRGERWAMPNFGSSIMSYAFADTSATMLSMMENDIRRTIIDQEPRLSSVDISINHDMENDALIVNISYIVAENHTAGSLVFPFYLQTGGVKSNGREEYIL